MTVTKKNTNFGKNGVVPSNTMTEVLNSKEVSRMTSGLGGVNRRRSNLGVRNRKKGLLLSTP